MELSLCHFLLLVDSTQPSAKIKKIVPRPDGNLLGALGVSYGMRFTKMQGVGNDFVVVDGALLPQSSNLADLAVQVCTRHFGIGADGLLVVEREPLSMRMFNPDGSEDMCGNGLRCVALWAHQAGWVPAQTEFTVQTKEGPRLVRLLEVAPGGRAAQVQVGMGVPQLASGDIPFCIGAQESVIAYPLTVVDRTFSITAVNTGSTHTVIFTDELTETEFQHYSPILETHPLFPERTSIMWATAEGTDRFRIRIWERGAGETLGCGTGACAVGVAAQLTGQVAPGAATQVISKGGTLEITWPGIGQNLTMVGPAAFVYEGLF